MNDGENSGAVYFRRLFQTSIAITLLTFVCTNAIASNWTMVRVENMPNAKIYLNKSSVVIDGDSRHAWFKYLMANMRIMQLHVYNCKTREMRLQETIVYLDGERQPTPENAKPSKWFAVEPETEHEFTMKSVCAMPRTSK